MASDPYPRRLRGWLSFLIGACAMVTLGFAARSDAQETMARERFEAGVAELQRRMDAIARQARGVHGADYVAEVATRPTGDYIAIIVRALSNDPKTREVCDGVRQHFLERLTGVRGQSGLPEASATLMEELFVGPTSQESEAVPDEARRDAARRLVGKTSLTVALSWRRCAGWLFEWEATN